MDEIIRAVSADGFVKMQVITARGIVQRAQDIHHLTPTTAAALGRTLCAASMLGELMKEDDASLTIRVQGGGPIGSVIAASDHEGNVRGVVGDASVDLPLRPDGKLDVGGAVGRDGMFTVSRDIGLREPYIGSTALVSGEIAEDLAAYLVESEQIAAASGLGVLVDTDRSIKAAGGFIVQLLPGAPESLIEKLEDNIFLMDQLTTILAEDGAEAVLAQVMKGLDAHIVERHGVEWRCPCSRERVANALESIGAEALSEMAEDGRGADVDCQFCGAQYAFSAEELREMAARVKTPEKS